MKKVFTAIALFLTTSHVWAQAADLSSDMKQIGALYKTIGTSLNDVSQNQKNAANAEQMAQLFQEALNLVPDTITKLPADQQAAAIAEYKSLMQQEVDAANALEVAILKNDKTTALNIMKQMGTFRSDGHDKFKDN